MRALIVADLHYSLPQFDWLVDQAARFDLVVLAGDHLDLSSLVDGRAQTLIVQKYVELLRDRTRVVICCGCGSTRQSGPCIPTSAAAASCR